MKVVVPPSVIAVESDGDGGLVNTVTKEELRLDARAMEMWRALVATGDLDEAVGEFSRQRPGVPDRDVADEMAAFVSRLAHLELVTIVDDGWRIPGLGAFPANHLASRVGRRARELRESFGWWLDAGFDRRFGTDTTGIVAADKSGVEGPSARYAVYYEATPTRVVRQALTAAVPAPEDYVFIDYGSGKGRTLLLASELPFRRVIGVELSWKLHAAAKDNIRRFRSPRQRCRDVTSVCADGTEFELPAEGLVLYFYTPFQGPVFDRVLARIGDSFAARPRPLIIIAYSSRADQMEQIRSQPFVTGHREVPLRYEPTRAIQRKLHVFTNG